ncbi:hypothetical protein [Mesorhizobium sp.]|uniref:hypothetical protein n=1 Tax=Mesorhizobium sp. TaxID=1871066 RepID=UPI00257E9A60|nr:hypothetical protein [Mesorhizobium sp.]
MESPVSGEVSPITLAFDCTHRGVVDGIGHVGAGAAEKIDGPVGGDVDELLELAAGG